TQPARGGVPPAAPISPPAAPAGPSAGPSAAPSASPRGSGSPAPGASGPAGGGGADPAAPIRFAVDLFDVDESAIAPGPNRVPEDLGRARPTPGVSGAPAAPHPAARAPAGGRARAEST